MEAIQEVKEAIHQYGVPIWVAYVSSPTRNLVPKETMRELQASAKVSEGWTRQHDGRLIFGRTSADAVQDILFWAKEHIFEMVTVKQVAEACDVSEGAARRTIKGRPDVFKKFGKEFEIRDDQADRKADKK